MDIISNTGRYNNKQYQIMLELGGALSLLISLGYSRILGVDRIPYMYLFYLVAGLVSYLAAKEFGREVYLLILLPRILMANNIMQPVMNMSINNSDLQNPLKISAFMFLWMITFMLEFVELLRSGKLKFDRIVVLGIAVIGLFGVITLLGRGGHGLAILIENYFVPFSFLLLFYLYRDELDVHKIRKYMTVMLVAIMALATFGIIEAMTRSNPFGSYFLGTLAGEYAKRNYRVLATVGHILFPIIMLFGCMITKNNIRNIKVRIGLYVYLLIAASLSQTRLILLIAACYVIASEFGPIFYKHRRDYRKLFIASISLCALAGGSALAFLLTPMGKLLLARFMNDSGSSNARVVLIKYFFENLFHITLLGLGGFAEGVHLLDEAGNAVIAEIPWINLYFEVGPLGLLLLLVFLFFVIRAGKLRFEMIMLLVVLSPYTALATKTQGYLLLFFMAIFSIAFAQTRGDTQTVQEPFPAREPRKHMEHRKRMERKKILNTVVCLCMIVCVFSGFIEYTSASKLDRKYHAAAELYVFPLTFHQEDLAILTFARQPAIWINKFLTDDIVRLAMTPEVINKVDADDLVPNLRIYSENSYDSRLIRIEYTGVGAEHTADVVNTLAKETKAYTTKIMGFESVKILSDAPVPKEPVYPKTARLVMIHMIFTLMIFAGFVLFERKRGWLT
jgi:capsular polysaccharide biosynthesis protein